MDLQGSSNQEIANHLSVSLSTIEKDLHEIRQQARDWFKEISPSKITRLASKHKQNS